MPEFFFVRISFDDSVVEMLTIFHRQPTSSTTLPNENHMISTANGTAGGTVHHYDSLLFINNSSLEDILRESHWHQWGENLSVAATSRGHTLGRVLMIDTRKFDVMPRPYQMEVKHVQFWKEGGR